MKKAHKSKTLWFNLLMLAVGMAAPVGTFIKLVEPRTAVLVDGAVVLVASFGNAILRIWFTDTPIDTPKARAKISRLFKPQ